MFDSRDLGAGDEFKQRRVRSWLDVAFSRFLARRLTDRLLTRCKGQRGLMITLTYRREEWSTPRDVWRAQSERQHVPLFMRRLGRALGENFSGRWLAKAEFQQGGWVHFHIVLLGVLRIDHELIERTWGHGYVWVSRLTQSRLRYACKYVAKAGGIPAFLYASRRVTLVRTSTGFWLDGDEHDVDEVASRPGDPLPAAVGYVPIGERIARAEREVVVRSVDGRFRKIACPVWELVAELRSVGRIVTRSGNWLRAGGLPAGGRSPRRGPPALHLNQVHKPDAECWSWLDDVLLEACLC